MELELIYDTQRTTSSLHDTQLQVLFFHIVVLQTYLHACIRTCIKYKISHIKEKVIRE